MILYFPMSLSRLTDFSHYDLINFWFSWLLWYVCGVVRNPGGMFLFVLFDVNSVFRVYFSAPFYPRHYVCKYTKGIKKHIKMFYLLLKIFQCSCKKKKKKSLLTLISTAFCCVNGSTKQGLHERWYIYINEMKFLFIIKGIQQPLIKH